MSEKEGNHQHHRGGGEATIPLDNLAPGAAATDLGEETPINFVQLNGLVAMKIIKHYQDDSTLNLSQGVLVGLVNDKVLEVTNCFPLPHNKANEEGFEEAVTQLAVMHRWKSMNVDNFKVGWYQSGSIGSCLSLNLLEAQFHCQSNVEESVAIVYDSSKASYGICSLKAYRLAPQTIKLYKENNFTVEVFRNLKVGFENFFIEVPIVIKNSLLMNIMINELTEMLPEEEGNNFLDLGTSSILDNDVRSMIDKIDDFVPEILRYNRYQQMILKQEAEKYRALAKLAAENTARTSRGEPSITEEEILKQFRPITEPQRLIATLTSSQINSSAQHMTNLCSQSLAKLFITETLQRAKDSFSKNNKFY